MSNPCVLNQISELLSNGNQLPSKRQIPDVTKAYKYLCDLNAIRLSELIPVHEHIMSIVTTGYATYCVVTDDPTDTGGSYWLVIPIAGPVTQVVAFTTVGLALDVL
jgi:hypothetical protein